MKFEALGDGRLDKVISDRLGLSRNQIEGFIKKKGVFVNGKIINKTSFKICAKDEIFFEPIEVISETPKPCVDFDVEILYEDEDLLVVNKPPFLTVHPAPSVKEATLTDWLIDKGISLSTISGEERRGIVHRIDKETSGALVVAKNNRAHQSLSRQLQDRSMGRFYLALIDLPLKEDLTVDKPIARSHSNRLKMGVVEGGREAKSFFFKLALSKDQKKEMIMAKLSTGRTHQIRVHLSWLSRHILGDDLYGFKSLNDKINRVFLHAYLVYFVHPSSGEKVWVRAPLFDDFASFLYENFEMEQVNEKMDPNFLFGLGGADNRRLR